MGYMTTITFLNDVWPRIKDDPMEFTNRIQNGMNGFIENRKRIEVGDVGMTGSNGVEVARSHHADNPRLYLVYQNCMTSLGSSDDEENLEFRKGRLKTAKLMIKLEEAMIKRLEQLKD